jgi:hypothetical protein
MRQGVVEFESSSVGPKPKATHVELGSGGFTAKREKLLTKSQKVRSLELSAPGVYSFRERESAGRVVRYP